jgi:hypothetical protein
MGGATKEEHIHRVSSPLKKRNLFAFIFKFFLQVGQISGFQRNSFERAKRQPFAFQKCSQRKLGTPRSHQLLEHSTAFHKKMLKVENKNIILLRQIK